LQKPKRTVYFERKEYGRLENIANVGLGNYAILREEDINVVDLPKGVEPFEGF
jgi:hypothetical protein